MRCAIYLKIHPPPFSLSPSSPLPSPLRSSLHLPARPARLALKPQPGTSLITSPKRVALEDLNPENIRG